MGRLFWKIFLGFWLTLLITGSLVGGLVWQHNKQRIEQLELLVDSPRAELGVKAMARLLERRGTPALLSFIERRNRRHHMPFPMMVINDRGEDILGREVSEAALGKAQTATDDPTKSGVQRAITPEGEQYILFIPRQDHMAAMHQPPLFPRELPLWPLLITFFASIVFSALLAWSITRPIRLLRDATNRFADGRLDTRVMPGMGKRSDEIAGLAMDFDHMAERVQQLVAAQKRLLNDVSHELRSPLARLQVAVGMTQQQPEKTDELLQRIEKESRRLDELVGELLTLSRLEVNTHSSTRDCFDINGLIISIVEDARFEASSRHKQIRFEDDTEILVSGNMELLRRALENVIRNAVYYTPEHSQVEIQLQSTGDSVEVRVCDNGTGVAEEKLPALFEPFVRISDNDQNIKIPGYGLGLAIARRAVELHRGAIRAHNRAQGGLCIVIDLPVSDAVPDEQSG